MHDKFMTNTQAGVSTVDKGILTAHPARFLAVPLRSGRVFAVKSSTKLQGATTEDTAQVTNNKEHLLLRSVSFGNTQ